MWTLALAANLILSAHAQTAAAPATSPPNPGGATAPVSLYQQLTQNGGGSATGGDAAVQATLKALQSQLQSRGPAAAPSQQQQQAQSPAPAASTPAALPAASPAAAVEPAPSPEVQAAAKQLEEQSARLRETLKQAEQSLSE